MNGALAAGREPGAIWREPNEERGSELHALSVQLLME